MLREMICAAIILIAGTAMAVPPVLTLHVAEYIADAPLIDGKLDDACWQTLPQNATFYKLLVLEPTPTPLRTAFQMGYNEKGVYLGCRMFMDDVSKLKATITQRNDPNIWLDDCAEIYFDANAAAIGFRKFTLNALATRASLLRMDPANIDASWSPDGWQAATSQDANGWYLEAFFPWSDLGKTASDGDLWRFCLCRYAWNPEILTTSAVGATFTNPDRFGWLLFLHDHNGDTTALAHKLQQRIPGDWLLPLGDQVLLKSGDHITQTSLREVLTGTKAATLDELTACAQLAGADASWPSVREAVQKIIRQTPIDVTEVAAFQQSLAVYKTASTQLEEWKYTFLLQGLFK